MTKLLQQVMEKLQQLPPYQQDAIATLILAELEDDENWETSFAATTDEQWERMAEITLKEIANGETVSLEEIFPSQT